MCESEHKGAHVQQHAVPSTMQNVSRYEYRRHWLVDGFTQHRCCTAVHGYCQDPVLISPAHQVGTHTMLLQVYSALDSVMKTQHCMPVERSLKCPGN